MTCLRLVSANPQAPVFFALPFSLQVCPGFLVESALSAVATEPISLGSWNFCFPRSCAGATANIELRNERLDLLGGCLDNAAGAAFARLRDAPPTTKRFASGCSGLTEPSCHLWKLRHSPLTVSR
jgi:hypothetical protein